jgi:hypothetical protein
MGFSLEIGRRRRYDTTVIIANGVDLEVGFPASGIANKTATIKDKLCRSIYGGLTGTISFI